jgi:hypothetical protein
VIMENSKYAGQELLTTETEKRPGVCATEKKAAFTEANCESEAAKAHKGKWEYYYQGECYSEKKGEYANANCTVKATKEGKGKYEVAR